MFMVQVKTELPFQELLQAVEQLSPPDLEQLMFRVTNLQARHKSSNLSAKETELLLKINRGMSLEMQNRFDILVTRRQSREITPEELQELLTLTEQIERSDAERVRYLVELAQLREKLLTALMDDLGISAPDYA